MKKYYLHNGTESSGPFDIEEIKIKKISKESPVWFEGMQHWKKAEEISELSHLFIVTPPPITSFSSPTTTQKAVKPSPQSKILGLSKNSFLIVLAVLIISVSTIVFNTIRENRDRELRVKNHQTEVENRQFELKQKELEEQKIQAVIQEQIDEERLKLEKKQNVNSKLAEVNKMIVEYQKNLNESEKKLNNTLNFKLLRTTEEKKEQIDLLQKYIDSFRTELSILKNESNQLKLELEKLPK